MLIVKMGCVAHDAHDGAEKQVCFSYYAGLIAMLFLCGVVGIVGRVMFFP